MSSDQIPCTQCGASLDVVPGELKLKCPYCNGMTQLRDTTQVVPASPSALIPMGVSPSRLEAAFREHLAKGTLTPDDLVSDAVTTRSSRYFVPVWKFVGEFEANWSASFGYQYEEKWQEWDNNNKTVQNKTRTVYDWRPMSGEAHGGWSAAVVAASGMPGNVEDLLEETVRTNNAREFMPALTTGYELRAATVGDADAWNPRGIEQRDAIIGSAVYAHAQGDKQKDWHWDIVNWTKYDAVVATPICEIEFTYRDKEYKIWLDGVSGSTVVGDSLPKDTERLNAMLLGFAPLVVSWVVLWLGGKLGMDSAGALDWLLGKYLWLLFFYGAFRTWSIYSYSKQRRASALTRLRAESSTNADLSEDEQAKVAASFAEIAPPRIVQLLSKDRKILPVMGLVTAALLILGSGIPKIGDVMSSRDTPVEEVAAVTVPVEEQRPAEVLPSPVPAPVPDSAQEAESSIPAAVEAEAELEQRVMEIYQVEERPVLIASSAVPPNTVPACVRMGCFAKIQAVIDTNGVIESGTVLFSSDGDWTNEIYRMIQEKRLKFQPGRIKGKAVRVRVEQEMKYPAQ